MAEVPAARQMVGGGKTVSLPHEKRRSSRKHVEEVRVKRAANGGHIVSHHYRQGSGPYEEPKEHVFGGDQSGELMDHLKKHLGINRKEAAAKAAEGSPAEEAAESPEEEAEENKAVA